ncbi:hypothetical protein AURDEDRAFT_170881 [Auricularia subglabra TFB-10046 SS5]|nr:hypothetical protein AURDEDRAFT_170881 [Auricularia subglabra TFB-10046 SS5]
MVAGLAREEHHLLYIDFDQAAMYRPGYSPPSVDQHLSPEWSRTVWRYGTTTSPILHIFGVYNRTASTLGHLNSPETNGNFDPYPYDVQSREVALTFPKLPPGHGDEDISGFVINQFYCLELIKHHASFALQCRNDRTQNWTRFAHNAQENDGNIIVRVWPCAPAPGRTAEVPDRPLVFPCYTETGERIGNSPTRMNEELVNGRWIKLDVQMEM